MPTPPITQIARDGSNEERIICTYKRSVPEGIQTKLENWLKRNYADYVQDIRWISEFTIRITLWKKCLCEAGAYCVEQALKSKCGP